MCTSCKKRLKKDHEQHNYVVAGGKEIFRGHAGYAWKDGEMYCIEHWRLWLRYGLADADACEEWVAWAEGALRGFADSKQTFRQCMLGAGMQTSETRHAQRNAPDAQRPHPVAHGELADAEGGKGSEWKERGAEKGEGNEWA